MLKYVITLIALSLVACEDRTRYVLGEEKAPCELVLDKLEACLGVRPVLLGSCRGEHTRLLGLSCDDLISELGIQ